jgi:murein L,D-transpeptidase YcbB/YkuD
MHAPDLLVDRLQRYFHHSDPDHEYLTVGDRAAACRNLRDAFSWLHVSGATGSHADDADMFDHDLEKQVKAFQRKWHHPIVDGKVGPNTRSRLVRAVLDRFEVSVFPRLEKNEDQTPHGFHQLRLG